MAYNFPSTNANKTYDKGNSKEKFKTGTLLT